MPFNGPGDCSIRARAGLMASAHHKPLTHWQMENLAELARVPELSVKGRHGILLGPCRCGALPVTGEGTDLVGHVSE